MFFAITCIDRPNSAALRVATRPAHIAYVDGIGRRLLLAGPLLDDAGGVTGSLLVVEAADRAAAERFAAADPYKQADLFSSVVIQGFNVSIKDGARLSYISDQRAS